MNKKLVFRFVILFSLVLIMNLLLLVSTNFSQDAVINVVSTLCLVIFLAIVISWSILRRSK